MKHFWTILLAVFLWSGFSQIAYSQKSEGQLTIKETREVKRLVAIFEQQLDETQDVEQAINAIATQDWFEKILRHSRKIEVADLEIAGISQTLLINYPYEYRRAWIAFHNLLYLLWMSAAAQATGEEDGDLLKFLPADILQIFQGNRYWAAALKEINGETATAEDLEITSFSELFDVSSTAEQGSQLLRTHLQHLNAENQKQLQQRMAKNRGEMNSEPHLHICNDKCASLPDGTRTAVMDCLMFQLTFAKVGEEMKLVLIASRIGE